MIVPTLNAAVGLSGPPMMEGVALAPARPQPARAQTSAVPYERDGRARHSLRNGATLAGQLAATSPQRFVHGFGAGD